MLLYLQSLFSYIPPGYPSYNLDPNYGAVSMVADDSKISNQQQQPSSLKEERLKENPSPNEHPKMQPQVKHTLRKFNFNVLI